MTNEKPKSLSERMVEHIDTFLNSKADTEMKVSNPDVASILAVESSDEELRQGYSHAVSWELHLTANIEKPRSRIIIMRRLGFLFKLDHVVIKRRIHQNQQSMRKRRKLAK